MKLYSILTVSAFLMGASFSASAAVGITDSPDGTLSTMPGSAADYTFFGNASEFPGLAHYDGTHSGQPTVLTDFTVAAGANAGGQYSGDSNYSLINGPTGSLESSVGTGDLFGPQNSQAPNMVDFTLGTPGSTFNFSDFDVFVMYGNGPGDPNDHITNIDLSVLSPSLSVLASDAPVLVTDANTSTSVAFFEEFHITGASAGDVIQLGTGAADTGLLHPSSPYLGGVSFEVPEPSTWAMMLAGIAFLGFRMRSKATRFQV
jgi:hypothetical protein